jgi:carbon-monoxide dehydrogenase medium subunit
MYPAKFRYFRPQTLAEAVTHLTALGEDARVLAGGQSLIPMMKLRLATPAALVDLGSVPGMSYLSESDGVLRLGALTRHRSIELASLDSRYTLLHDAASVIADVQVRNRGTIGGALAQADPAGDWGPVFLALDAVLHIVGPEGARAIPLSDFLLGPYYTALQTGEIIREIEVRTEGRYHGGAYLALKQRAGDFALASAAVQLAFDADGFCRSAGIALGNVAFTPIRAPQAEAILVGRRIDESVVRAAAGAAVDAADPMEDSHRSVAYQNELVEVLVRRAIEIAVRRSRGERVDVSAHT